MIIRNLLIEANFLPSRHPDIYYFILHNFRGRLPLLHAQYLMNKPILMKIKMSYIFNFLKIQENKIGKFSVTSYKVYYSKFIAHYISG